MIDLASIALTGCGRVIANDLLAPNDPHSVSFMTTRFKEHHTFELGSVLRTHRFC